MPVQGCVTKIDPYAKSAGVPARFHNDLSWTDLQPDWAGASSEIESVYPLVTDGTQRKWLRRIVTQPTKFFAKPLLVAVMGGPIGDHSLRVAFGIAMHAVRHRFRVQCLEAKGFDVAKPKQDVQVALLYNLHVTDTRQRSQLVRDFLSPSWGRNVCKLIQVSGSGPLTHIYQNYAYRPHAVFYYPGI